MDAGFTIAVLAVAFMTGALPTAYLMGRMRGIDLRRHGSGNVGATNALRVLGRTVGLSCLAVDIAKGWLPVVVLSAGWAVPRWTATAALPADLWPWMVGIAAIAGHIFTPWLGFRGGKGVATSLGVLLAIVPVPMLVVLAVGIAMIAVTRYVSVASIGGALALPWLILILDWGRRPWFSFVMTLALGAAIVWKHRGNIARLRAGTEKKLFGSH